MEDYAIEVDNLTIRFNLASEKVDNLKEYFIKLANDSVCCSFITERNLFCLIQEYVKTGKIDCLQMKPSMKESYDSHLAKFQKTIV